MLDMEVPSFPPLTDEQEDILGKKMIWIFGSVRSGTTWLGRDLLNHSSTIYWHEPYIGWLLAAIPEWHYGEERYFFSRAGSAVACANGRSSSLALRDALGWIPTNAPNSNTSRALRDVSTTRSAPRCGPIAMCASTAQRPACCPCSRCSACRRQMLWRSGRAPCRRAHC